MSSHDATNPGTEVLDHNHEGDDSGEILRDEQPIEVPPPPGRIDPSTLDLHEDVVELNRCAKVVKGGRRFSFAALVVVGDGNGHVGVGFGKANEVPDSIQKAVGNAKRNLIHVPIIGRTVPHEIIGEFGAARILIKPAAEGTGLIAGPAMRAVLEAAGIQDVLTKVLGSDNNINVVKATYSALQSLQTAERTSALRGMTMDQMLGKKAADRYRKGREDAANNKSVLAQQKREEKQSRRGTYSAGGRRDDGEEGGRGGRGMGDSE